MMNTIVWSLVMDLRCDEEFANMQGGGSFDKFKVLVKPSRPNGPKDFKWTLVRPASVDYFLKIEGVEGEAEGNSAAPGRSR